jgi:hypothetical protein
LIGNGATEISLLISGAEFPICIPAVVRRGFLHRQEAAVAGCRFPTGCRLPTGCWLLTGCRLLADTCYSAADSSSSSRAAKRATCTGLRALVCEIADIAMHWLAS